MSNEEPIISAIRAREAASVIQWHPGFCGAVEFELRENRDVLKYDYEFEVSRGALFLDLLVVKKEKNVCLKNEIGRMLRTYNIWELKSETDRLTIDNYFKGIAYACLLKNAASGVNAIPAEEITLTFVWRSYPRAMIRALTESGAVITEKYPGVYYLSRDKDGRGDVLFPTQIIVTGELDKKHSGLRVLTRHASEDDVRLFLQEALYETEKDVRQKVDDILQVSVAANMALYERLRRDDKMCQALRELFKDEIEQDMEKRHQDGLKEGRQEGAITGAIDVYRNDMRLDNDTIIKYISAKFNLPMERARAYVIQ